MAGCQNRDTAQETSGETNLTIVIEETTTETSAETDEETEKISETAAETESTSEETAAETQSVSTQKVQAETEGVSSLLGTWCYSTGDRLTFGESQNAVMALNLSSLVYISDGTLYYDDAQYTLSVSGNHVTAVDGGETLLSMTAEEGTDASGLIGYYRMESCTVADAITTRSPEEYTVHIDSTGFFLEFSITYTAQDGVLQLQMFGEESPVVNYVLEGDVLHFIDENDVDDTLTRVVQ